MSHALSGAAHGASGAPAPGRTDALRKSRLLRDLDAALASGGFALGFAPSVCLRTGLRAGAEAQILWPHRKRGPLSPTAFLPLAEETGRIVALGGWALREACHAAAAWPGGGRVAVNVWPRQIRAGRLLIDMASALDDSALPPERLALEIEESALLDEDPDVFLTLAAARDLGVELVLDAFGVGLASLAVLRRVPLTGLKLDRSLIRLLPRDRADAAIVQALVRTAQALELCVRADGIDTEEQRAFLAAIGCDEGQGQLFAGPDGPPPA